MRKLKLISSILGLTFSLSLHAQNKIYVDETATSGQNNGSSWTDAYTSLSAALNHANTNLSIDSVLVAKGTYKPETVAGSETDDIFKTFFISRSGISVIGGYANGGGVRDVTRYSTMLNGNIGNLNDREDNVNNIMLVFGNENNLLQDITLDGLEFTEAYGRFIDDYIFINGVQQMTTSFGSALVTEYANVNIKNCKFYNNSSQNSTIVNLGGNVVYENIDFYENVSDEIFSGILLGMSKGRFNNIRIYDNTLGMAGGTAIMCNQGSLYLSNSEIKNNISDFNSGVSLVRSDTCIIDNVVFQSNEAMVHRESNMIYGENEGYVKIVNSKIVDNNV